METTQCLKPAFRGGCLMDISYSNACLSVLLFGPPRDAVCTPSLNPSGTDPSDVLTLQYGSFVRSLAGAMDIGERTSARLKEE